MEESLADQVRAGLAALDEGDLAGHPDVFATLDAAIRDELRRLERL